MQINSHGKHIKATPPQPKVNGTNAGDGAVAGGEVEQVKPQRLLERLQGDAKVREQLLVEVKAKIAAGEYATREAAVETAQQIIEPN
jgi:hypothetical protein